MKRTGRIDRERCHDHLAGGPAFYDPIEAVGMLFRPPSARGVKVFEAKSDRVDHAVALGTLRLFLVHPQPFAGGDVLAVEPRELRHVRRRRRRRALRSFRSTHAPRSTGLVRSPLLPMPSTAAMPKSPPRGLAAGRATLR